MRLMCVRMAVLALPFPKHGMYHLATSKSLFCPEPRYVWRDEAFGRLMFN